MVFRLISSISVRTRQRVPHSLGGAVSMAATRSLRFFLFFSLSLHQSPNRCHLTPEFQVLHVPVTFFVVFVEHTKRHLNLLRLNGTPADPSRFISHSSTLAYANDLNEQVATANPPISARFRLLVLFNASHLILTQIDLEGGKMDVFKFPPISIPPISIPPFSTCQNQASNFNTN